MTPCKCRWDAAGHKILSNVDMLKYYQNDPESLKIVKANMPHRYVCLPAVEIHIHTGAEIDVTIYQIYPGETRDNYKSISVRALEGLRATFRGRPGWRVVKNQEGLVVLRREGRVILDPKRRYGLWS